MISHMPTHAALILTTIIRLLPLRARVAATSLVVNVLILSAKCASRARQPMPLRLRHRDSHATRFTLRRAHATSAFISEHSPLGECNKYSATGRPLFIKPKFRPNKSLISFRVISGVRRSSPAFSMKFPRLAQNDDTISVPSRPQEIYVERCSLIFYIHFADESR
jgi:hypothetical protein